MPFNPEEYSLNKDNNFASQAIPGLTSPLLQFVHGNLRTLDMELFFDTFESQSDVRDQTQQISNLLNIDSDLHTPPVLQVAWGSLRFPLRAGEGKPEIHPVSSMTDARLAPA